MNWRRIPHFETMLKPATPQDVLDRMAAPIAQQHAFHRQWAHHRAGPRLTYMLLTPSENMRSLIHGVTPAMAADLTEHVWSIDELIQYRCRRE
jgi:hypothetical protein